MTDPSWEKSGIERTIRSVKIRGDQVKFWLNPEADPYLQIKRRYQASRKSMKNWVDWDAARGNSG